MDAANTANLLGALVVLISDQVTESLARDQSLTDATALSVLAKYSDCSVEMLRVPLALSHSGCVRLVDRLEIAGWVQRRAAADGRAVALHLTRKGRDAAGKVSQRREQLLQRMLAGLSAPEQSTLAGLVTKLLHREVAIPALAMRTCRLCDYEACKVCPMHKFAQTG
jgi:MarR family transcriptional regulator, negative regulator of the multidrug operon emrRAB